jgi:hypothetical protein
MNNNTNISRFNKSNNKFNNNKNNNFKKRNNKNNNNHYDKTFENNILYSKDQNKKIIIELLYKHINDIKTKDSARIITIQPKKLQYEDDLYCKENNINNIDYCIEKKYKGEESYLIFCRNKDYYYSCIINKKNLPENDDNIILNNIHLISFDLTIRDIKIYEGTILDGIYYKDQINKKNVFYINDIIILRGNDRYNVNLKNKMLEFKNYLNKYCNNQDKLVFNTIYDLNDIEKAVKETQNDNLVSGLLFYNIFINTNFSFLYQNIIENKLKIVKEKPIKINDNNKNINFSNYSLIDKTNDNIFINFSMKYNTNNRCYELFLNNNFIDHVTLKLSEEKLLKSDVLKNKNIKNICKTSENIIIKCFYKQNKWHYKELESNETKIEEFLKYFKI